MSSRYTILFGGETQPLHVLFVRCATVELLLLSDGVIGDGRIPVLIENVVAVIQTQTCLPALLLLILISCRLRKHKVSISIKLLLHLFLTVYLVILLVSSDVLTMCVTLQLG